MTDTELVHKTIHDLRIVVAAVTPTRVLPAPQGKTMIPDRARLCMNRSSPFSTTGMNEREEVRLTHFQTFYPKISLDKVVKQR